MVSAKDLRTKDLKGLNKMLSEQVKELEKTMHEVYKGKEKNLKKAGFVRKDIARIKTVLAEKKFMEETNA